MKDYRAILEGERLPRYRLLKGIEVDFTVDDELSALLGVHELSMERFRHDCLEGKNIKKSVKIPPNLLELKVLLAHRLLEGCVFCHRNCKTDRAAGEVGFCGVGSKGVIASEFLHLGEEPELIPSHTIFFRGCTLRCAYCQNWDLLPADGRGFPAEPEILTELIMERARQGSINVNWVGGDPTPNLHTVLGTLNHIEENLPQVWNSNMYCSGETMALLEGAVDVYLADMRYGNDECAVRLSSAPGYWETVTRNFMHANTTADVLVRHLVLPGHLECCTKPIIEWCAENLGKDVRFNLMFQYRPENRAREHGDINRNLNLKERKRAREIASDTGLVNITR